jgi:hypothetical protein
VGGFPVCRDAQCFVKCGDGPGGPIVPDFDSDPQHCGACNVRCPTAIGGEAQCQLGECQSPCDAFQTACDGRCVNPGSEIGRNCVGEDVCCPRVNEGPVAVPALGREGHAVRIVLDRRRRVEARLTFNDGTCTGYDFRDLPDALKVIVEAAHSCGLLCSELN